MNQLVIVPLNNIKHALDLHQNRHYSPGPSAQQYPAYIPPRLTTYQSSTITTIPPSSHTTTYTSPGTLL